MDFIYVKFKMKSKIDVLSINLHSSASYVMGDSISSFLTCNMNDHFVILNILNK